MAGALKLMSDMVRKAILEQRPLLVTYKAEDRLFWPFLLGKSQKGTVLHGIQIKGPVKEWRFFYLEKVEALNIDLESRWEFDLKKTEGQEFQPPKFITEVLVKHSI